MAACAAGRKAADILLCIVDRQRTAVSDAKGDTTTTTYDSKGRLTKKTLQMKEASCILIPKPVKKLEKLFIAPKVRQVLYGTSQRALARCACA